MLDEDETPGRSTEVIELKHCVACRSGPGKRVHDQAVRRRPELDDLLEERQRFHRLEAMLATDDRVQLPLARIGRSRLTVFPGHGTKVEEAKVVCGPEGGRHDTFLDLLFKVL